jgi:DMSO/TMAO reductase YedYZ molybdopterin-dependent catalytic subunit
VTVLQFRGAGLTLSPHFCLMKRSSKSAIGTRREFLRSCLLASGALLTGTKHFDYLLAQAPPDTAAARSSFKGGRLLGLLDFAGESQSPLDTLFGTELDARLFSDLSRVQPESPMTSTDRFYVRTSASRLLPAETAWVIRLSGLVEKPGQFSLLDLRPHNKSQGRHLMECAGNHRTTRFGMISVADWAGVPLSDLLSKVGLKRNASRVMVSGFDTYSSSSRTSVAGADWIFTLDELAAANAFLATEMNGQPLTRDHGAPLRLVVPGWYGCTGIKWVTDIKLVSEEAEATSQMREFAARTHQTGAPLLARDYTPARIDQAAMPTRVEKWLVNGKAKYRVVGILWGGTHLVKRLEIRFNPEEDYVPVSEFTHKFNDPWTFWSHAWEPKAPGTYMIRLRVTDPPVTTKRLDSGYYLRMVEITEI